MKKLFPPPRRISAGDSHPSLPRKEGISVGSHALGTPFPLHRSGPYQNLPGKSVLLPSTTKAETGAGSQAPSQARGPCQRQGTAQTSSGPSAHPRRWKIPSPVFKIRYLLGLPYILGTPPSSSSLGRERNQKGPSPCRSLCGPSFRRAPPNLCSYELPSLGVSQSLLLKDR